MLVVYPIFVHSDMGLLLRFFATRLDLVTAFAIFDDDRDEDNGDDE